MNNMLNTQNGKVFAPGLKFRGRAQNRRVAHGVKSGQIDQAELQQLKGMRAENRQALSEAKESGGYVNLQERLALHQDMREVGSAIRAFKQ